jgi:hypothetical protein
MPGWALNETWMAEEGVPHSGLLSLAYFSGGGSGMRGCRPVLPFRKALCYLVCLLPIPIVAIDWLDMTGVDPRMRLGDRGRESEEEFRKC